MADKKSLGLLGIFLSAATVLALLMSVLIVKGHVEGRLALDPQRAPVSVGR